MNAENLKNTLRMVEKLQDQVQEQAELKGEGFSPDVEKLMKLYESKEGVKALGEAKDAAEVQKVLRDYGMNPTLEEAAGYLARLQALAAELDKRDGKLSNEELAGIAGGTNYLIGQAIPFGGGPVCNFPSSNSFSGGATAVAVNMGPVCKFPPANSAADSAMTTAIDLGIVCTLPTFGGIGGKL